MGFAYSSDGSRKEALFINDANVPIQQLNPPPLAETEICWEALATVEVTQLTTLKDWGSELSGTYIGSFKPLTIGKFHQCMP